VYVRPPAKSNEVAQAPADCGIMAPVFEGQPREGRSAMARPTKRLKLHGFNNLTKTLSFNIYDICYAVTAEECRRYMAYVKEMYNSERLAGILDGVVEIIGAQVLNTATQNYDPMGASVTMLIAEEPLQKPAVSGAQAPGPLPEIMSESVVQHLDKSHITAHTYPESHPQSGISTFRVDIDVSTCGKISPLTALNHLIHSVDADIVTLDYRVRGFTRNVRGRKHFIDHNINSIQNFLSADTRRRYEMIDVNVYQENIFHTKMILRDFDLDQYLFGVDAEDLPKRDQASITRRIKKEMLEIFYGRNM
jgi:S-adenosylmethionine decarboxylase